MTRTRCLYSGAGLILPALLFILAFAAGCGGKDRHPPYSPHENLLSIVAEFNLLAPRDPYREPVGRDLTGQSIARSTLVRLANYEQLHPGRLTPDVLAWKARTLELMGDFETAQRAYREAASYDTAMKAECGERAALLDPFIVARNSVRERNDLGQLIAALASQSEEFRVIARGLEDEFHRGLALREAETADIARTELIISNRFILADGDNQAEEALTALVANHRDSARAYEHALRLARFHRTIAEEEVRLNPPELGNFSGERFKRHYDKAVDLLYRISQADGRPERLIARHELDALLQFGELIQERAR